MAEKTKDPKAKTAGSKPDFATIGGLVVALGGILGGLVLEGGELKDVSQITAAAIVLGGTLGAVMVSTPLSTLISAAKSISIVFFEKSLSSDRVLRELIEYATKARKDGIVSLEQEASEIADPFFRKALNLAVDGTDLQELRKMMELEISMEEHKAEAQAKVYESAGGFAPTVGIIGAVMGLIQVMKDLGDIDKVGHGIAVAFVATVYGVGIANLFLLPAAGKIKARAHSQTLMKELVLEGVIGIVEGLNPKLIQSKLEAYIEPQKASKVKQKGAVRSPAEAEAEG
jgi:chemotaxis protein MotA